MILTDTPSEQGGSAQFLEVRHRGHGTAADCIRCGKDTGIGRFLSRKCTINAAWLERSLAATDLLAWMRVLLLEGDLATAEPKKLRHRLLHVAARLTRGGRRLHLRIFHAWPWRNQLVTAFRRLAALAARPVDLHVPDGPHLEGPRRHQLPRLSLDHTSPTPASDTPPIVCPVVVPIR
uniref:Transposase n=1 Tax=Streptomyces sp. NBC_00003 TaxID=2903608 RepID=A0AAU2V2Z7_9ACTN